MSGTECNGKKSVAKKSVKIKSNGSLKGKKKLSELMQSTQEDPALPFTKVSKC